MEHPSIRQGVDVATKRLGDSTCYEVHQLVRGELYSDEIVRRLGIPAVRSGMVLDVQLRAVNQDPQITVAERKDCN